MSPSEAVKDAVEQFKVQGVNLDNLDVSVPSDENRANRARFLEMTALLDKCVDAKNGTVVLSNCGFTKDEVMGALKASSFVSQYHRDAPRPGRGGGLSHYHFLSLPL